MHPDLKLLLYTEFAELAGVGRGLVYAWAEQRNQVDHETYGGHDYVVMNDRAKARLENLISFWSQKPGNGEKVERAQRFISNFSKYGKTVYELGILEEELPEEPKPRTPERLPDRLLFQPTTQEESQAVGDKRFVECWRAINWVGLSSVTCSRLPLSNYKMVGRNLLYRAEDVEAYRETRQASR